MLEDEDRCPKVAHDGRSFWYFGLSGMNLYEARRCRLPLHHSGKCSVHELTDEQLYEREEGKLF